MFSSRDALCARSSRSRKSGDIMDLQVVLAECKAIVHDYESSSAAGAHTSINPSDFPGIACESLASLCAVTEMEFAVKPNNSSYAAGYSSYGAYGCSGGGHHAAVAGSQQWCSDCGLDGTHLVKGWAKPCFLDPRKERNVPPSVWVNKARLDAIIKGRDDNARKLGISACKLIPPTDENIQRFKEYAASEGGGKGGGNGGGRGGGGGGQGGGGGRGGGSHAAFPNDVTATWTSQLVDISEEAGLMGLNMVGLPELNLFAAEAAVGVDTEAYAVSDGVPIAENANIFSEEEAVPGRARRSAERGLPAALTTPQALKADLATTSPALPPTTPGAPGYLGSSVSAEFPGLGSAFCVGGSGPGGDYLQVPAIHYSRITASAAEADVDLTSWRDSDRPRLRLVRCRPVRRDRPTARGRAAGARVHRRGEGRHPRARPGILRGNWHE